MKTFMFDYGGVLAEEGFKKGIKILADRNNKDAQKLKEIAFDICYKDGLVVGAINEGDFFVNFKKRGDLKENANEMKKIFFDNFTLRPFMIEVVKELKKKFKLAILSDQSNWLDELDKKDDFFKYFDFVFNSYHTKVSKKSKEAFTQALSTMKVNAEDVVFIDDHMPNIKMAKLATDNKISCIFYEDKDSFLDEIKKYLSN